MLKPLQTLLGRTNLSLLYVCIELSFLYSFILLRNIYQEPTICQAALPHKDAVGMKQTWSSCFDEGKKQYTNNQVNA